MTTAEENKRLVRRLVDAVINGGDMAAFDELVAVLPTYLAFVFPEAQVLIDVRILRLVRVFRIFKLTRYLSEVRLLGRAMANSMRKILVFLSVVVMVVLIVGTLMYVIEGPENGFTSIPKSIYWALSTITTVGYGDIVPRTELGRALASIVMLIGWGILAVPTGIVTAEMTVQELSGMQRANDVSNATRRDMPPTRRTAGAAERDCLGQNVNGRGSARLRLGPRAPHVLLEASYILMEILTDAGMLRSRGPRCSAAPAHR